MQNTLITLAQFHYELGYIGHDEYRERVDVALWLSGEIDDEDPRSEHQEEELDNNRERCDTMNDAFVVKSDSGEKFPTGNEDNWLKFLCLNIWVFTKADPDSYPSVPHGHYKSQNKAWPKLNPYTGRVFSSKHQEDKSLRLSQKEMKLIWNDEKFKSFCREMIVWYQEQFPYYGFHVRHTLRFPRW
ncbi:hypothetical protein O1D97_13770 [Marinomonas sp. 15G1-11]|uniref:Uncharacterized protein n=1 Tax=Marinomonas phaeophyticola TaxID=3004091 RepID=A0ABT4JWA5_9GAMM|nr:hypothetical protein [Marinomonas sp. 15G1-11]MCZ2722647.1 hypothetical protein [Marinomonas sp. 15G1-11]